jgi:demethoxyubiquinone hydroxylase (CLK1/Coq7/Cat5 family)
MDTTPITTSQNETRELLASLLRGELAAIETYEHGLRKIDGPGDAVQQVRGIHREHIGAAEALRRHLLQHTSDVPSGSGAWGAFAMAVGGTAGLLGNKAALKALQEGEEHGVRLYEKALDQKSLSPELRTLLAQDLLPKCRAHVATLERLRASA